MLTFDTNVACQPILNRLHEKNVLLSQHQSMSYHPSYCIFFLFHCLHSPPLFTLSLYLSISTSLSLPLFLICLFPLCLSLSPKPKLIIMRPNHIGQTVHPTRHVRGTSHKMLKKQNPDWRKNEFRRTLLHLVKRTAFLYKIITTLAFQIFLSYHSEKSFTGLPYCRPQ